MHDFLEVWSRIYLFYKIVNPKLSLKIVLTLAPVVEVCVTKKPMIEYMLRPCNE